MKTIAKAPKLNAVFPTRKLLKQLPVDARFRTMNSQKEYTVVSQTDLDTMTVINDGSTHTVLPKVQPVLELKTY